MQFFSLTFHISWYYLVSHVAFCLMTRQINIFLQSVTFVRLHWILYGPEKSPFEWSFVSEWVAEFYICFCGYGDMFFVKYLLPSFCFGRNPFWFPLCIYIS